MKSTKLLSLIAFAIIVMFAGCKKDTFEEIIGECPIVVATNPEDEDVNVPLEETITVTFNKEMNPSTINNASIILQSSLGQVPGIVTYDGETATFNPTELLAYNTIYTGIVKTSVKDTSGNALQVEYIWSFTTISPTLPIIISTDPQNLATNVPLNKVITATFNKEMNPLTITGENVTISTNGNAIAGAVTYANNVATFTPVLPLVSNTVYVGKISKNVSDLEGFNLADDYNWTFTTLEVILPVVVSTDPANLATNVPLNKVITATFSKAMNPLTIIGANVTISANGNPINGVVTYLDNVATFTPATALLSNTTYTGKISKNVADDQGNNLTDDYTWTFTTLQITPPTVISTDPQNLATGVALNKIIKATFSKAMNPLTIIGANVTISANGNAIAGLVSYENNIATFTPSTALLSNTVYTGKISQNVTDTDGTKMANDFTWTFTTIQIVPPTVISTDPQNLATNVLLNKTITATFSKAMNSATVIGANVTISTNGNAIAGSVSYANNVVTFNPTMNLLPNTVYTGKISKNVEDSNGTKMVNDYTWTFTTVQPVAPTVILTDPNNLETGVALNKTISATFSESMNPLTITNNSFVLTNNGNIINGVVIANGNTATFNPNLNLESGKTYIATITTAAQNLSGTAMESDYTWTFSTNAASGPNGIDLDCVSSFGIIAGSTVTNTGPTVVDGNLGLSPGTAVVGFPPGTVINGSIKINDTEANNAKNCLTAAYIDAAGRSLNVIVMANGELGGLTLAPGLYKAPGGSFDITSVDLTLDAQGDPNAVWIFQMPSSTLTVGNGVKIILAGGASAKNIFWQVGSSATIGTTAQMKGTIMADQSITLKNGAVLLGRALAMTGAVTLENNAVTIPK